MKQHHKARLASIAALVGVVGLVLSPALASAAADSDNTTINAVVGSTISLTSGPTVTLNITPIAGGSQTSNNDTVTVNTNNATGYELTFSDNDADTDLISGANTIDTHTGTFATPTALANNSWGYAVPSTTTFIQTNGFDASYSVINNASSSASVWAGIPVVGSPQLVRDTNAVASNHQTPFWYSAKVDTSLPNGTYSDVVLYTATTNP